MALGFVAQEQIKSHPLHIERTSISPQYWDMAKSTDGRYRKTLKVFTLAPSPSLQGSTVPSSASKRAILCFVEVATHSVGHSRGSGLVTIVFDIPAHEVSHR